MARHDGGELRVVHSIAFVDWQELRSAWDKIAQMADLDKQVLAATKDIKTQLQPFYQKIDESSQLIDETHHR